MKGHRYFVACSGLTTKLQGKHRKHTIPDDVDENLLARLLAPASSSEPSGRDQVFILFIYEGTKLIFVPHRSQRKRVSEEGSEHPPIKGGVRAGQDKGQGVQGTC
jgi:hypothetical protein